MIILGLTGSIGMGKSTTATMFREEGIPVYDADAAVHLLYEGKAVDIIEQAFPGTTDGKRVDRSALAEQVVGNSEKMKKLESLIHPLVAAERENFLKARRKNREPLVVLDIPLLFETGAEKLCDMILVVTAPAEIQKQRVMSRPGMSEEKFTKIRDRQMPDAEKRDKADFIIDTSLGIESAKKSVAEIIEQILGGQKANA